MIGLENRDRSFFKISAQGSTNQPFSSVTNDIISFSVTEETGKMLTGSVSFYDPYYIYHDIFRMGKPIEIEWGYNRPASFFNINDPVDQLQGNFKRTGIKARIQSPSGGGTEGGVKTYNCNFIGREYRPGITNHTWKGPTRWDVINSVMGLLNIAPTNRYIDFKRGKEGISANTYVMQWESDFNFLRRMSFEWGALLDISTDSKGNTIGMFADRDSKGYKAYCTLTTQAVRGSYMTFNYMNLIDQSSTSLVRSFTWQQNGGGGGDNVQISMVGGQVNIQRFNAATETTIVYKLDSDKMAREMKGKASISEQTALLADWLSTNNFEDLIYNSKTGKGYFVPTIETTAPQGLGFTINLKCLGNPMISPPCKAVFESNIDPTKNFPSMFQNPKLSYWIRKVTHNMTTSGYECDVEIVDGFTASGGVYVH